MIDLPVSQLAPEFVAELREQATSYIGADKERSTRQWTIGVLVAEGLDEWHGKIEDYWTGVIYELNEAGGQWIAFSESNVRRWVRTVQRFESVNIENHIDTLPFEYFAVAGEIMAAGGCDTITEPLDWALNTQGSAEDMRRAFRQGGPNAPAWDAWKSAWNSVWADKYSQLPETVRARIDPLKNQIDKIIEESEIA